MTPVDHARRDYYSRRSELLLYYATVRERHALLLAPWRDSDRAHRRASRALYFERQTDEGKFVAPVLRQFLQVEIFDDVDAVMDKQYEMTWKAHVQILINDTD